MPGISAVIFIAKNLDQSQIRGKRVIDVGSYDFNGSIRPLIESWNPNEYIGVDILEGPGVDRICNADNLIDTFSSETFDIVLSVEMLEHTKHWQCSISNLKQICKPGGIILLTTRSYGYPCHGFPCDFWRYEKQDMEIIFSDMEILALEKDYQMPGIFVKAKKPFDFREIDLSNYELYSLVVNKRIKKLVDQDFNSNYFKRLALKQNVKNFAQKLFLTSGKAVTNILSI